MSRIHLLHNSGAWIASLRSALFVVASFLAACGSSDGGAGGGGPTAVTSGTIGGLPFTVVSGTLYQDTTDGPVRGDAGGATLALDDNTAALGMSDPLNLRLDWEFRLEAGGLIRAMAFDTSASLFSGALGFEIARAGVDFDYRFDMTVVSDITGTFSPGPADPNGTTFIVTEFYGVDAPGYGAGSSGITAWPLDDMAPAFNTDILSCPAGVQTANLTNTEVGYFLQSAVLVSVTPVDDIVGPCE